MADLFKTLAEAVALIEDGASLAITKFNPMAGVRELVRQRRTGLRLIGVPTAGFAVDLLIAAGCARSVETGAFVLGGHGPAVNAMRAIKEGRVVSIESACPLIELQLRAGASGLSFTPVPGLFGSDIMASRAELRSMPDPYDARFDVAIAPALRPDAALIHGLRADAAGNIVTTVHNEDRLVAQAARIVIATVEEVRGDALQTLAADEQVIPALYFDAVAEAPGGALPLGCPGHYPADGAALKAYLDASRSADAMAAYVEAVRAGPSGGDGAQA
jgi:glutaconate CoA-transferase subunit A